MKKAFLCCVCLGLVMVITTGCATSLLPMGAAFADVKLPMKITANKSVSPKVGAAYCTSFFGLVAIGDFSLDKAMKNGGITKVHYVDLEIKNIAGFAKYKLLVYGE